MSLIAISTGTLGGILNLGPRVPSVVPSQSALRSARSHLGEPTNPTLRACTVAVAPVRLACLHRVDHSHTTDEHRPVANHIVVALDIAQDRARGLEALAQWQPEWIVRAW